MSVISVRRRHANRQIQMRMKLEDERQALAAFVKKFDSLGLGGPVFPVSSIYRKYWATVPAFFCYCSVPLSRHLAPLHLLQEPPILPLHDRGILGIPQYAARRPA